MQCDEIRLFIDLLEFCALHAVLLGKRLIPEYIIGHNLHTKAQRAPRHALADRAQTNNAKRPAIHGIAEMFFHLTGLQVPVGHGDGAGQIQHHAKGIVRHRVGVCTGRIERADTQTARRLLVHIVHAHTVAGHDLQLRASLHDPGGHRLDTKNHCVVSLQLLDHFVFGHTGLEKFRDLQTGLPQNTLRLIRKLSEAGGEHKYFFHNRAPFA